MLAMDHFLEVQGESEAEEHEIDQDLLFTRVFFMGLAAGIIFEKRGKIKDSPVAFCKKAEQYVM